MHVLTPFSCWHAQHGCLVVNAPTANTVAAAEHGIALICALSRNVAQADASVKAGKWERSKYVGVSIVGKTLAVMGFGKVRADRSDCTWLCKSSLFQARLAKRHHSCNMVYSILQLVMEL